MKFHELNCRSILIANSFLVRKVLLSFEKAPGLWVQLKSKEFLFTKAFGSLLQYRSVVVVQPLDAIATINLLS